MGKYSVLALRTYNDIQLKKKEKEKQAERDFKRVTIDNINRIKKRVGRY